MLDVKNQHNMINIKSELSLMVYKQEESYVIKQIITMYTDGNKIDSFQANLSIGNLLEIYHIAVEEIDELAKRFNFKIANEDLNEYEDIPALRIKRPIFVDSASCEHFKDYIQSLIVANNLRGERNANEFAFMQK